MSAPAAIALIGIGCRFPGGADDPERFWQLLNSGQDAFRVVPPERWDFRRFYDPEPGRKGKTQVREAAFLQQPIDAFDPLPFGISPREAEQLDPQQRLLLEVSWEALEDAGQDIAGLRGSPTGVFIGGFCLDAKLLRFGPANRELHDVHTAASATMTMLANRISYVYDLRGPSFTIDTACSSSLVAVHQACLALRAGHCDMALAGGVNALIVPDYFIALSQARMLSPLARSMAFDVRASGYARGEGCGVIVLKTLEKALADGDPVRAVVVATGINQDGRTSGITLPNPQAQAALIRSVYREAGIAGGSLVHVEAHGTGTQAGDKAELETLGEVLAENRPAGLSCTVGAVKTQIGHLEAAAGIAGVIKTALVLEKGQVPPNLHRHTPNPAIDGPREFLRLPAQPVPLAGAEDATRYAAVNSFGYGGTNAHALLRPADRLALPDRESGGAPPPPYLLPLSACEPAALRALAGHVAERLVSGRDALADILHTLSRRRSHWPHRLVAMGGGADAFAETLRAFAADSSAPGDLCSGEAQTGLRPPVFVYTGMGPQWWGMGRELARREAVFRQALEEVDALFEVRAGWSVLAALGTDEASSRVSRTEVAQPANLALQVALTRLWQQRGITPGVVVGHSIGEVAAAWSCGALSLDDAVTVAWQRSRLQQTVAGQGSLLAAALTEEGAAGLLREFPGVAIAAVNAPRSLTLAGSPADLAAISAELERYEVFHRPLQVEIPYHSPFMDVLRAPLLATLAALRPATPQLPWMSTALADWQTAAPDADYWWNNVRQPVRFRAAIERLLDEGWTDFVEIGPHPVLQASLRDMLSRRPGTWAAASLHREKPEAERFATACAEMHVRGHRLDFDAMSPAGQTIRLPTYPWQRQPHWRESRRSSENRRGRPQAHWLWESLAMPTPAWQVEINRQFFPWLDDHRVGGKTVFPGAGFVVAALALAAEVAPAANDPVVLEDLAFRDLLALDPQAPRQLVSQFEPATARFRLYSHAGEVDDGHWRLHAEGNLRIGAAATAAAESGSLADIATRCPITWPPDEFYQQLARLGLDYGPAFRRIVSLQSSAREVLIGLQCLPPHPSEPALPVSILDAVFHGLLATQAANSPLTQSRPMVPVGIAAVALHRPGETAAFAHLRLLESGAELLVADALLLDQEGQPIATLTGVRCRALPTARPERIDIPQYRPAWIEHPATVPAAESDFLPILIISHAAQSAALPELPCLALDCDAPVEAFRVRLAQQLEALPASARPCLIACCFDDAPQVDFPAVERHARRGLRLVQAASAWPRPLTLCCLTRSAQAANRDDTLSDPAAAALAGILRVAANEVPLLRCQLIDLDPQQPDWTTDWPLILNHLASADGASEIALRGRQRLVLNLQPESEPPPPAPSLLHEVTTPLVLAFSKDSGAVWQEFAPPPLAEDSAAIAVDRWLVAEGGIEWHGQVTDPGNNADLHAGQAVCGLDDKPARLATRLVVERSSLIVDDVPHSLRLPTLFAWHALTTLARWQSGEPVLLIGDVDPAFVAVARHLELPLKVASSNPGEGDIDCRSAALVATLRQTCPCGFAVIVVFAGAPALPLADGGLIVRDGRIVCIDGASVAQAETLLARGIALLPARFSQFCASRQAGVLFRQPPCPGIPADRPVSAAEAPAAWQHGLPVRPVVLELAASPPLAAAPLDRCACGLRRCGTYLVTGGTSGFGLALAGWLAEQGVARLVLASRSGRVSLQDEARFNALRDSSADIRTVSLDVGDAAAVQTLCHELAGDAIPLAGIFHGAMVLADGWLPSVDDHSLSSVLRPKVAGALNLHAATRALDLDCFVLFSSVSAWLGTPGQAAYAAANATLDSLALWRRQHGLTALSINWGAIADVGVAARADGLLDQMRAAGIGALAVADALSALGGALRRRDAQRGIFVVDWARWKKSVPCWPARFNGLIDESTGSDATAVGATFRHSIAALAPEARARTVAEWLRRQLARILRQPEERIPLSQAPGRAGLDSLLTLEWVIVIRQEWEMDVSAAELLNAASLEALADRLLARLQA